MYQETFYIGTEPGIIVQCVTALRFRNKNDHVPVKIAKTRGILGALPQETFEIKHTLMRISGHMSVKKSSKS